jgi:hypothetical protein
MSILSIVIILRIVVVPTRIVKGMTVRPEMDVSVNWETIAKRKTIEARGDYKSHRKELSGSLLSNRLGI